ncbi:MAG: family 20 glycosylhydrolase [Clostridia bacterium]|nr:family 20 glycosylhydrolase [Clostridia bacterium]
MIFPRVKQSKMGDLHPWRTPVRVFGDACEHILFVLREMMPYIPFERAASAEDTTLCAVTEPALSDREEYYELTVAAGRVEMRAVDYAGLVHAVATLSGIVRCENGEFLLPDATVRDYPDTAFRAFMSDPARNRVPTDELCAQILCMARAKYNKLHLHLSDGKGFAYESKVYPDLPVAPGGAYTRAELERIIDYAAAFGIDVIPEIDLPAHSYALTKARPELRCQCADGPDPDGWNVCLANEESYALMESLLCELAAIFPYEYIHVGTDEMNMTDILHAPPLPISHSLECRVCNAFFAPMGADTLPARFCYFVRRAHAMITALGKKMMMWNDDVDISKSPDIPRDILIEFWRVAAEGRGPVEGCSMQRFLDEGFEVVNADFPNAYVDEYVQWEKLAAWNLRREPADAGALAEQIVGGEMCAWEGKNYPHYDYVLYYTLAAFGDRTWNLSPIGDLTKAQISLTRVSLGCDCPDGFDLFAYTDGVPMGDAKEKSGNVWRAGADLASLKAQLNALTHQSADQIYLKNALLKLM